VNYAIEHRPEIKTLQNKILMTKTDVEMAKSAGFPILL
jgi:hypothetical protein